MSVNTHTQSLPGHCFILGTIGINLLYEVENVPYEIIWICR